MKRFFLYFIIISIPLIFTECKKDKLGISQGSLNGHWLEVEPAGIIQFAGTNHDFHFNSNGTFTLKREYWTDIINSDPCYHLHFDYIVGTYSYTSTQFILTGKYSNAPFTVLQPNVCGETNYTLTTDYVFTNGVLTLNANQNPYFQIALHKQ